MRSRAAWLVVTCCMVFVLVFATPDLLLAQTTVPAVLLSDPHFDPFRDPAKVSRLNNAPASEWEGILNEPASEHADEAFTKLQSDCKEPKLDANDDLLLSSFDAAAQAAREPAFVLVAGDLVVHKFDCRYRTLFAGDRELDRHASEFAEKTIEYVSLQLRKRFLATPVYIALGNNDTGCEDYRLGADSDFLRNTAPAITGGWPGKATRERAAAEQDYRHFGSYTLTLPAPMRNTRLLVLDDLYLSAEYKGNCAGAANEKTGAELLDWTAKQLAQARENHENVWVLAHIPSGVNTYSTYLHAKDVCHGESPTMFLRSQALADLLAKYASIVRVFISGHTHIDEMHLLGRDEQSPNRVVLKTVPSISPISQNPPSFLTARVDPKTAVLVDYSLHQASASTGKNISWSVAYDFDNAYQETAFDPKALRDLFRRFSANGPAENGVVQKYQEHAATGIRRLGLQALWPQYVCSMKHESADKFTECACPAASPKVQ